MFAGAFGVALANLMFTATHAHLIAIHVSQAAEKAHQIFANILMSARTYHMDTKLRHELMYFCRQMYQAPDSIDNDLLLKAGRISYRSSLQSFDCLVCITQCPIESPQHQYEVRSQFCSPVPQQRSA